MKLTTSQKNLLIAKFMGAYKGVSPYGGLEDTYFFPIPPNNTLCHYWTVDYLEYDYNWEWLFQVIKRIDDIYNYADERMAELINEANHNILLYRICGPSRELIYEAVVDFIIWYNEIQA